MSRRRRSGPDAEDIARAGIGILLLVALGIGGIGHFADVFNALLKVFFIVLIGGAVIWLVVVLVRAWLRERSIDTVWNRADTVGAEVPKPSEAAHSVIGDARRSAVPAWDVRRIRQRLDEIDWYQFEKFCAALLEVDGFTVERRGGAQPDGGVDLVVEKQGARALIQCKHWRTWTVQEKVVRELLGSMTHFGVNQGALYTLKGWTQPAAEFAAKHAITLVNGDELAASAKFQLSPERLEELLDATAHHCPKCESPMVWREGNFTPFWGCSRYPRCRATLKYSGAK